MVERTRSAADVSRLVLLRHGKSSYPEGVDDHDRPLSERGAKEASEAGRRLAQSMRGSVIDRALVSAATRAQQTWQLVKPYVTVTTEDTEPDLYLAEAAGLLQLLHAWPADFDQVLVVGHNNGLEDLATTLTGTPVVLKTSTFAVLQSAEPWGTWGPGSADLVEVVVAR
jgi:phosphohistidine phosphatase